MTASRRSAGLDGASDNLALLFGDYADEYDEYQARQKLSNLDREHYARLDEALNEHAIRVVERMRKERREMCFLLIGLLRNPVGLETSIVTVKNLLSRFRYLIIADFSQETVCETINTLSEAGVPQAALKGMQVDITDGLSSVARYYMEDLFRETADEAQFHEAAMKLGATTFQDIVNRQPLAIHQRQEQLPRMRKNLLAGGVCTDRERQWNLSIEGEPVPLDGFSAQMVTAGYLVPVESTMWDRFTEVCGQTNRAGVGVNQETIARRIESITQIFGFIARFNTETSARFVENIYRCNPQVHGQLLTDVNTIPQDTDSASPYYEEVGMQTRFDTALFHQRVQELLGMRSKIQPLSVWDHRSTPESHSHQVCTIRIDPLIASRGDSIIS